MFSNHKHSLMLMILLTAPSAHAGKLQDLLDWATGNTPDKMCRKLGIMYKENYNTRSLNPKQAKALEQIIFVCGGRNLALIIGAPKSSTKELDDTIKAAYPVIMNYIAKK